MDTNAIHRPNRRALVVASEQTPLLRLESASSEEEGGERKNNAYRESSRTLETLWSSLSASSRSKIAVSIGVGLLLVLLVAVFDTVAPASSSSFASKHRVGTQNDQQLSQNSAILHDWSHERLFDVWEAWKESDLLRLSKVHQHSRGSSNDDVSQGDSSASDVSPSTVSDSDASPSSTLAGDSDGAGAGTVAGKVADWFRHLWNSAVDAAQSLSNRVGDFFRSGKADEEWEKIVQGERGAWNATSITAERAWSGIKDKSSAAEARAKDWWEESTRGDEREKEMWNGTVEASHRAWDRVEGVSKAAQNDAKEWWEGATQNEREREFWNATAETTHQALDHLEEGSEEAKVRTEVWWNRTLHSEREWQQTVAEHLRTFGQTVRSWWSTTSSSTQSKVRVLEHNFLSWWRRTSKAEHQWWNDTVDAFGRFGEHTRDKSAVWWNLTRSGVAKGWQTSEQVEEEWWNATREWFSAHVLATNRTRLTREPQSLRTLVYLNSTRAFQMMTGLYGWVDQSSHFFFYQQGWDAQINQAYCGVASAAALLNSFKGIPECNRLPLDPTYEPYYYATQVSLVRDDCVMKHVTREDDGFDGVLNFPGGLSLDQVGQLLECFLDSSLWNVTVVHVTPSLTAEQVNIDLIRALREPQSRVIINFHRTSLGQVGGGHFSPLAAYNSQERMFLLMDVAKYKYPPVWVPAEALYAAMQTEDRCGRWDFPTRRSQEHLLDNLTRAYMSNSTSPEQMQQLIQEASDAVRCEPQYRGYILVQQII
jgi:hypothetical protein